MDEPDRPEEESVDISLTLSQASSIYIICENSLKAINQNISILQKKSKNLQKSTFPPYLSTKAFTDIQEQVGFLNLIKNDTIWMKKEVSQIVQELNPQEPKDLIVKPPKWT